MASAIMNAILDANRAADGSTAVDARLVEHALAIVVGMVMEADPDIRTDDDMRKAATQFAEVVRLQLAAFRREHERSGRRAWDAVPLTRQ